jgi:hypothetical protein
MADRVSEAEGAKAGVRALKISHDLFVGDKDLHNLLTSRQARYNWVQRNTYAWAGSLRLLESSKLVKFMQEFEQHKINHAALVERFASNLQGKISDAMFKRGALANRDDYPTEDNIRSWFTLKLGISEVPVGDFRNAVAVEQQAELHALYNEQAKDYLLSMQTERLDKLKKLMTSISKSCTVETSVGEDGEAKVRRKNLHAATIQNAIDLCDEIKRFNPIEDDKLEAIRSELATTLDGINIDAVRESDTMRVKLKGEVDQILSKF